MRSHRTWGPLSGWRSIVIIVCVIVGVIAVPNAGIAGGDIEKVVIKDATQRYLAKVSSDGRLQVGDGSGPLTVDGTVTLAGSLNLDEPIEVTGTVTDQNAIDPSQYVRLAVPVPGDGECDLAYTVPAGSDLVITSIQVAPLVVAEFDAVPDPKPFRDVTFHLGAACGVPFSAAAMTSADTAILPFVPGVLAPSGSDLRVANMADTIVDGFVFVFGYLIPTS